MRCSCSAPCVALHRPSASPRSRGDVKITFWDADVWNKDDHMFHFWLHTRYLRDHPVVRLTRQDLDKAVKKKNKDK